VAFIQLCQLTKWVVRTQIITYDQETVPCGVSGYCFVTCERPVMGPRPLWCTDTFSFGVFFFSFLTTLCCFGSWAVEFFTTLGPCISRNLTITHYRTNFGLAQTTEPPGHKPLVVNVVVVGPFEEEEDGIGVTSNIVKVKGEDPDTPGYQRGGRVRLGRRRSRIVGASPLARSR